MFRQIGAGFSVMSLLLIAQTVSAALLSPFTRASVLGCVGPNPQTCSQQVVGSTINTVLPAGTGTALMFGSAQSGYGVLRSSSGDVFSGSGTSVFAYVNGAASFLDVITIGSAPPSVSRSVRRLPLRNLL
jgi:hypothetical protein